MPKKIYNFNIYITGLRLIFIFLVAWFAGSMLARAAVNVARTAVNLTTEPTIPVQSAPLNVYEVRGQVRLYTGEIFPWTAVNVFDVQGNLVYILQTDHNAEFVFPGFEGETYLIRGGQPGYAYAAPEIKVENVSAAVSGLLTYAGPDTWFPAACQFPSGLSCAATSTDGVNWTCTTTPLNVSAPPCYVDLTATATDENGVEVTSEPVRFFVFPNPNATPTPTPDPTPTPSPEATPTPQSTPTPTPTPQPTITPLPVVTPTPTPSPTATPLPTPSPTPTATPTPSPSLTPTPAPCTTRIANGKKCKPGCVCL